MADRIQDSGYYGIPLDIRYDGTYPDTKELCQRSRSPLLYNKRQLKDCQPMKKAYFVQYQYMPFFVASLTVLFFSPYIIFKVGNADLQSLSKELEKENVNAENITKSYFIGNDKSSKWKIVINICVKLAYIAINVFAFHMTNFMLYYKFTWYGWEWAAWAGTSRYTKYDFEERTTPKPGDRLLPSMGFCDIHESSLDSKVVFTNKNKFICELSPHILYQYVFLVLWFVFVFGIIISVSGFLRLTICYLWRISRKRCPCWHDEVLSQLTLRQTEYLDFIKRYSMTLHDDIKEKLKLSMRGKQIPPKDHFRAPEQTHYLLNS